MVWGFGASGWFIFEALKIALLIFPKPCILKLDFFEFETRSRAAGRPMYVFAHFAWLTERAWRKHTRSPDPRKNHYRPFVRIPEPSPPDTPEGLRGGPKPHLQSPYFNPSPPELGYPVPNRRSAILAILCNTSTTKIQTSPPPPPPKTLHKA